MSRLFLSEKKLISLLAKLPLPVLSVFGYCLGTLFWLIPNKKRHISNINLCLCLPSLPRLKRLNLLRLSLINEAMTLLEIPALLSLPQTRLDSMIKEVRGLNNLDEGIEKGKGVILAIPHLGNWELIGLYASARHPMTSLYRPQHRSPDLDDFIRIARQRFGSKLVPTDASGVRALYKALENNEVTAILPDQNPGKGTGVFAPFFGQPANTMVLLPRLARRSGATVLYCYTERLKWCKGFRMHFIPADDMLYNQDAVLSATSLNKGLEFCIRKIPNQYWWSYKRFNVVPDGQASPYKQ